MRIDEIETTPLEEFLVRGMSEGDLAIVAEMQKEAVLFRANMPKPPPCPSWCVLEPGHPYEFGSGYALGDAFVRWHSTVLADTPASVDQVEENLDGAVRLYEDGPELVCRVAQGKYMSADDARAIARALLRAADDLERITSGVDL